MWRTVRWNAARLKVKLFEKPTALFAIVAVITATKTMLARITN
jgi:hypothetical protein